MIGAAALSVRPAMWCDPAGGWRKKESAREAYLEYKPAILRQA